jgi:hypothetical protein
MTAPWRIHRPQSRAIAATGAAWQGRRERQGNAAATRDAFLDGVVLLSVFMFVLLASGVGILVLQATTLHWPR